MTSADLAAVLDDPTAQGDAGEYLGGVAMVLENLTPAASLDDLTDRIRRMRRQPDFAQLGYRDFRVIGLDRAGVERRRTSRCTPAWPCSRATA